MIGRSDVDPIFAEVTTGIGWTHRAMGVRQKQDAIFVSPTGIKHHARRLPFRGSDHFPIELELQLQLRGSG